MSHLHQQLPDHVRRIIDREGDEIEFTPPSFERWLGRLQMLRTMSSMAAFMLVWLVTYGAGKGWEDATIRGIIAAMVFHFFAWAAGLFVFGELYNVEVKDARIKLEEKERDRARRIEEYYRERLRAKGMLDDAGEPTAEYGTVPPLGAPSPMATTTQLPVQTSPMDRPQQERYAA